MVVRRRQAVEINPYFSLILVVDPVFFHYFRYSLNKNPLKCLADTSRYIKA